VDSSDNRGDSQAAALLLLLLLLNAPSADSCATSTDTKYLEPELNM
jgi:hypothetical protein